MPHKRTKLNKLKALTKKVNKIAGAMETKTFSISQAFQEVNFDVDEANEVSDPGQGDGKNERVGDTIMPFRLNVNAVLSNPSVDTHRVVRMTIIQSKQRYIPVTDDASGVSQFYSNGNTAQAVVSPFHVENRTHYTVLFDRTYALDTGEAVNVKRSIKISKKIKFSSGLTTGESGFIFICFTSDKALAETGPSVQWTTQLLYKDS